jgi:hypothetical protein
MDENVSIGLGSSSFYTRVVRSLTSYAVRFYCRYTAYADSPKGTQAAASERLLPSTPQRPANLATDRRFSSYPISSRPYPHPPHRIPHHSYDLRVDPYSCDYSYIKLSRRETARVTQPPVTAICPATYVAPSTRTGRTQKLRPALAETS